MAKHRTVMLRTFGVAPVEPEHVSRDQWRRMLSEMGATPDEARDILTKLGYV